MPAQCRPATDPQVGIVVRGLFKGSKELLKAHMTVKASGFLGAHRGIQRTELRLATYSSSLALFH
jgi:hypothetical protein